MRLGDIRDRSLKLSEIAPNFGRALPSEILGGLASSKLCTQILSLPRGSVR